MSLLEYLTDRLCRSITSR